MQKMAAIGRPFPSQCRRRHMLVCILATGSMMRHRPSSAVALNPVGHARFIHPHAPTTRLSFSSSLHSSHHNDRLRNSGPVAAASRSNTALFGFMDGLQKFFLSGSSYDTRIDYSQLNHPGPELAEYAQSGQTPQQTSAVWNESNSAGSDKPSSTKLDIATFAGGCFWGMELAYQRIPGVVATVAGYTQGQEQFPTYDQVCAGNTGHTESVIVYYDPQECSYEALLDTFFGRVDPTVVNGQGKDYGKQYRTGVYFHTPEQEATAREYFARQADQLQNGVIATELYKAMPFWPAEPYHQQYLSRGGRFGTPQSAEKGATDEIRCYG